MPIRWDSLVGHALDEGGRYRLNALEEVTADHASYAIRLPDNRPGMVEVVHSNAEEGGPLLQRWSAVGELRHDFLSPILDVGQVRRGGEIHLYRVTERPDTTLAAVLANTKLTEEEGRDITLSVLSCLDYLHAQGFVHGAVTAEQVIAVGDRTKLTPFTIHEQRPDSTPAEDMHRLGQLVVAMFGDNVEAIPEKGLRALALACLSSHPEERPRADEALRRLTNPATAPVAPPVAVRPIPPVALEPEEGEGGTSRNKYLWALIAVVFTVVVLLAFRGGSPTPTASPAPAGKQETAGKAAVPPPAATPQASPVPVPVTPPVSKPSAFSPAPAGTWGIIAATYKNREAAERRVVDLKKRYPACDCSVFPPEGNNANYYVLAGSSNSRLGAERIRQQAARAGLPRDMYVTRLSPDPNQKKAGRR